MWPFRKVEPLIEDKPEPVVVGGGSKITVAVLALKYGDQAGIHWAWSVDSNKEYALGFALAASDQDVSVIGRATFEIPLAPEIEVPPNLTGTA